MGQHTQALGGDRGGQFDGQQSEQRRELDHRVERHRGGVLVGVTDGVAHDGGVVQRRVLRVEIHLDEFLRVVPGSTGVRHEDGLVEPEQRHRDEEPDEQERFGEGERQGGEEHAQENVEHTLLGVLGADLDHLVGILGGGLRLAVEVQVLFDELHCPVGARGDGLHGGAREPVDHRAAQQQAQQERGVQQRQVLQVLGELAGQAHHDGEDHGGGPHHGGADQHRFRRRLEGVARAVVGLEEVLGAFEVGADAVIAFQFLLDAGDLLDGGQLEHRLGVVGDGTVGVDGDRHGPHAQETERDQTEREHRGGDHELAQPHGRDDEAQPHQSGDRQPDPVAGEVAGHQAGEDVQRRPALVGGDHDLAGVAGVGGGEHLHQLRDQRPGQGAAADDQRQLPPHPVGQATDQRRGGAEGARDAQHRGQPHQRRQGRLEVHLGGIAVAGAGDGGVDEVRDPGGHHHHGADHEDPHQQLHLHHLVLDPEEDEGDQRHTGHAVGFETVRRGADGVAGVVARAVGDHAGVAGVVLLDVEDDLHQVGADVGDLGEDPACDAQRRRAQRFTDRETDETRTRDLAGQEHHDDQHHRQLDGDQHHADAHPGAQRDVVAGVGAPGHRGVRGAGVGQGVDADAVPGHRVAAAHADQREQDHHGRPAHPEIDEEQVVDDDDGGDEGPQQQQEPALLFQVGLAGGVDQLGYVPHRRVHGHAVQLRIGDDPEHQAEGAHDQSETEQHAARQAEEGNGIELGQLEVRLPADVATRLAATGIARGETEYADRGSEQPDALRRIAPGGPWVRRGAEGFLFWCCHRFSR